MNYQKKACITRYIYWFCYENGKEKKNSWEIYLEEYKYRVKKAKMSEFKEAELESESESELESDTELEPKSKLESSTE